MDEQKLLDCTEMLASYSPETVAKAMAALLRTRDGEIAKLTEQRDATDRVLKRERKSCRERHDLVIEGLSALLAEALEEYGFPADAGPAGEGYCSEDCVRFWNKVEAALGQELTYQHVLKRDKPW